MAPHFHFATQTFVLFSSSQICSFAVWAKAPALFSPFANDCICVRIGLRRAQKVMGLILSLCGHTSCSQSDLISSSLQARALICPPTAFFCNCVSLSSFPKDNSQNSCPAITILVLFSALHSTNAIEQNSTLCRNQVVIW